MLMGKSKFLILFWGLLTLGILLAVPQSMR